MSGDVAAVKPRMYGYIRALPELPVFRVQQLRIDLVEFAEREGFQLEKVFVEHRWLHTVAWDALVTSCNRFDVRDVVVPDFRHLHSLPALSFVMQKVIEDVIQGRVWCVHPDGVVPTSPPLTAPGGGVE